LCLITCVILWLFISSVCVQCVHQGFKLDKIFDRSIVNEQSMTIFDNYWF
jgi:hypothetical protein